MNESTSISSQGDFHVHSQWSWDAPQGAMEETCRAALAAGLEMLAFTEHADYSDLCSGARFEVDTYLEELERCRRLFPRLRILSGVELGEPHRHVEEATAILERTSFERILGSAHSVVMAGQTVELSELSADPPWTQEQLIPAYFEQLLELIRGPIEFEILSHSEYMRRFWPASWPPYRSEDYEEQIRAVLEACARRGLTLEFNTSRGGPPQRALCPGPQVLGWWREAGGRAISFGSDAHDPSKVGGGFVRAAELAEAAGFRPAAARIGIWEELGVASATRP